MADEGEYTAGPSRSCQELFLRAREKKPKEGQSLKLENR